jgi:signal transduction histidine kinase
MTKRNSDDIFGEVLIVEDTPESLELLSELMTAAGYDVRQAQDGDLALLSVQAKAPDLILLDVRMPGLNGFQVCHRLKANPATADIPVIFLSALQDMEAKVQGFQLGAVDYIGKPYQVEEVLVRVRTHMELRNLQLRLSQMVALRTAQLKEEIVERRHAEAELLESKEKLRELSGHLEDVREAERARIAREIHDELGQSLTVARIDLTRIVARLSEPRERIAERLNAVIDILDHTADTARTISENLRPGMLDVLGLGAAIEHHVARFTEATHIPCTLTVNRGEFEVDSKAATAVFRIVQEALTNVARHAQAKNVSIQVADLDREVLVIIQDDGRGMPTECGGAKKRTYGLLGMSERATLLGGNLQIESTPGMGTRIEASIPRAQPRVEA